MHDVFIYANGDSFVEGCELGDFLIDSHPGYYNFHNHRPENLGIWLNNSNNSTHPIGKERDIKYKLIKQEEQQRNFAYKLHKKLNSKLLNKGKGGSSFERIVRTTILDLLELKKHYNNIVAIIGTSEPTRMSLPDPEVENKWVCQSLNTTSKDTKPVLDYYLRYGSNYHAMISFYKNVIQLQDFCKLNGIKLLWVAGNSDITEQHEDNPETNSLMDYANFKYSVSMPEVASKININAKAPGYHFTEIVHEQTAELLLGKI